MVVQTTGAYLSDKMRVNKPLWLKSKIPSGNRYFRLRSELKEKNLSTICQAAKCPNISECWNNNHAAFLILGDTCTRDCGFCSVKHGIPKDINPLEADHLIRMISIMGIKYAVITSVTRDDLKDGGSLHFKNIINKLRSVFKDLKIEVLIPDFNKNQKALENIADAKPDVLNHNLETVQSVYPKVNRKKNNYTISLKVLKYFSNKGFLTKSGIMLGLGETRDELIKLLDDLRASGVVFLTIGQYLQPTRDNVKVEKYYTPDEFMELKEIAFKKGFTAVQSGPFIRSSYHADLVFEKKGKVLN